MTFRAGLLLALLLAPGCARKEPVEVEFAGRAVDRANKPLAGMALHFHPSDESNKRGRSPTYVVQNDGRFAGKALPGLYKVTLVKVGAASPGDPKAGVTASADKASKAVPEGYTSPARTPWEVIIPAEGKQDIALQLR